MPVLVHDVLKHRSLMDCAVVCLVVWSVPSLGREPELMLFSVPNHPLRQNASTQPAERFPNCNGAVSGKTCGVASLGHGCDKRCLPELRTEPVLKAELKSSCKQGGNVSQQAIAVLSYVETGKAPRVPLRIRATVL